MTNQPDIDAAAERLLQIDKLEQAANCVFPSPLLVINDWKLLADAYLAQRVRERAEAEERAKPVDNAWLSVMFTGPTESRIYYSWDAWQIQCGSGSDITTLRIIVDELDDADATYMLEAMTHEAGEEPTWSSGFGVHIATRGQVLDLLRALGVEPKREGAGR